MPDQGYSKFFSIGLNNANDTTVKGGKLVNMSVSSPPSYECMIMSVRATLAAYIGPARLSDIGISTEPSSDNARSWIDYLDRLLHNDEFEVLNSKTDTIDVEDIDFFKIASPETLDKLMADSIRGLCMYGNNPRYEDCMTSVSSSILGQCILDHVVTMPDKEAHPEAPAVINEDRRQYLEDVCNTFPDYMDLRTPEALVDQIGLHAFGPSWVPVQGEALSNDNIDKTENYDEVMGDIVEAVDVVDLADIDSHEEL